MTNSQQRSTTGMDRGDRLVFLGTAVATDREQRFALIIGGIALCAFLIAVPFVRVPLAQFPAFIPTYEAALFFIDLITALLLFDQFVRLRSPAILVLASAYLFDALVIIPHALSFPGAFAPSGMLGAGPQTTAWLYVFWHGGFPLFVIAYAMLRRREASGVAQAAISNPARAIATAVAATMVLVVALALLATWGHDALPVVMQGSDYSLLVSKGISPAVWALTFIAMVSLWQRPLRVVDLWLMLVMWIWLFDIALAAVIGSKRFDLGFYAGRVFGLIAAGFLLVTLLIELARTYAGALGAAASAQQRVANLMRARERTGSARDNALHSARGVSFIHRQNIAHYRSLLESPMLDDAQRRSIEKLLSEEEAKSRSGEAGE
jgi:hypothetical protein